MQTNIQLPLNATCTLQFEEPAWLTAYAICHSQVTATCWNLWRVISHPSIPSSHVKNRSCSGDAKKQKVKSTYCKTSLISRVRFLFQGWVKLRMSCTKSNNRTAQTARNLLDTSPTLHIIFGDARSCSLGSSVWHWHVHAWFLQSRREDKESNVATRCIVIHWPHQVFSDYLQCGPAAL